MSKEIAERVLGKAVHPAALDRLFEVWPEAIVEVAHSRQGKRFTVVKVYRDDTAFRTPTDPGQVAREAICHPDDQFDRHTGIRIAFDRCLREAVRRADPSRVMGNGRTL